MRRSWGAAVAGIGQTVFSKSSGVTEYELASRAVRAAIEDAGLGKDVVDGMVTYTVDRTDEIDLQRSLGLGELRFFSRTPHGGGGSAATVQQAAMAVSAGVARAVVCYRALNGRSGTRLGGAARATPSGSSARTSWHKPFGVTTPAQRVALISQRYAFEHAVTSEDFGRVSVLARKHAANNPDAVFHGAPITLEEHQASRMIATPLRLLDCCLETDGGVAVLVTSLDLARKARHPAAVVRAAAQGSATGQEAMSSFYREPVAELPEMAAVARQLWSQAGIGPQAVQVANLYDHFTPYVLMQLEDLGFVDRGEAAAFIADGNLELSGSLPSNTNGGQLGEAYVHGMNGITEAVRQIRGHAVNQVADVEHALVTAGTGVPTSGLVLGQDQ